MTPTDAALLRDYAARASERAFADIVARHTDLVYSAALRQTGVPETARDIAQGVFTDLARKAGALAQQLDAHASLAGWLYHATRFAVLTARREERRRQAREKMVMEQFDPAPAPDDTWAALAPVLDEAMAELGDTDREAVVLRYFQNRDFSAVAVALGVSEAAAQKRVSRAVERLRDLIAKRGVTTGASGLVVLISANAVLIAPAGLSAAITVAVAGITVATTGTATIITMSWINAKAVAAIVAAALIAGTGTYFVQEQKLVHAGNRQRELAERQAQLTDARDAALAAAQAKNQETDKLRKDAADLARLRNEVTQLHQQLAAQKILVAPPSATSKEAPKAVAHAPGAYIPKDQLAHVGYGTPEAALETITWAMLVGTYEQFIEGASAENAAEVLNEPKGREQFEEGQKRIAPLFKSLQIEAKKILAADKVELKIKWEYDPAMSKTPKMPNFLLQEMIKVGNEWKINGSTHEHKPAWEKEGQIQTFTP